MPPAFLLWAMPFHSTRCYCSRRMDWGNQGGHNWWWIVQSYCIFLGQPKSLPPAIHCIYQKIRIMGISATVIFGREWHIVVIWRYGKETGGDKCKGKEEEQRRRGGDNCQGNQKGRRRKGREERMVVYSNDNTVKNDPWGPLHSTWGTLWWGWKVLVHGRLVFLGDNIEWYWVIHCGLQLMPMNQPPEQESHGPSTTTFYCQRLLAKNCDWLRNWPANLGKSL